MVQAVKLPPIHHLQFRFPTLALVPKKYLPVRLCSYEHNPHIQPSVSPILGTVVCPVSSPLLWIQEELLFFHSAQIFIYS